MSRCEWIESYQEELSRGVAARKESNEGMARVCARRAAGIMVMAYLEKKGYRQAGKNILNNLRFIEKSAQETGAVREIARHFIVNITPDHVLPDNVDLLLEVEKLKGALFPEC